MALTMIERRNPASYIRDYINQYVQQRDANRAQEQHRQQAAMAMYAKDPRAAIALRDSNPEAFRGINLPDYTPTPEEQLSEAQTRAKLDAIAKGARPSMLPSDDAGRPSFSGMFTAAGAGQPVIQPFDRQIALNERWRSIHGADLPKELQGPAETFFLQGTPGQLSANRIGNKQDMGAYESATTAETERHNRAGEANTSTFNSGKLKLWDRMNTDRIGVQRDRAEAYKSSVQSLIEERRLKQNGVPAYEKQAASWEKSARDLLADATKYTGATKAEMLARANQFSMKAQNLRNGGLASEMKSTVTAMPQWKTAPEAVRKSFLDAVSKFDFDGARAIGDRITGGANATTTAPTARPRFTDEQLRDLEASLFGDDDEQ